MMQSFSDEVAMNTLPSSMHEVLGIWEVFFIVVVACVPVVALIVGCTMMCYVMTCSRRRHDLPPLTHWPHCYVRGVPHSLYRQYMPQEPA